MGKRSVKDNKNIYFQTRDDLNLSRAEASEATECLSESQLAKIEYGTAAVQPGDVMALAKAYHKPSLCNYYCTHECPIGREYVPEVSIVDLSKITLQMLASLNNLEKEKDRLIDITADGSIDTNELDDFALIEKNLNRISLSIESLKVWFESTIAEGKIDKTALE